VGDPGPDSHVLVTANYKMSFDALRRELAGLDAWILVLETQGINVWCAAGKGTFGTEELVCRVKATRLAEVVTHRSLIVPQLGAPGVAAHQVRRECGFSLIYGPVRARDIRAFLAAGMEATAAMRTATFGFLERLAVTPVELVLFLKPAAWTALAVFVLSGFGPGFFSFSAAWDRGLSAIQVLAAGLVAGAVMTPLLLPWLPWRTFSAKGALVGSAVAVLAAMARWDSVGGLAVPALLLGLGAVASYVAMNFTGATPYTSPSGVEKEMRRAIPAQAGAAALAALAWIGSAFSG
jgi:hypothetical protein